MGILGNPQDQVVPGLRCPGKDNVCKGHGGGQSSSVFMTSPLNGSRVSPVQIHSQRCDPAPRADSLCGCARLHSPVLVEGPEMFTEPRCGLCSQMAACDDRTVQL